MMPAMGKQDVGPRRTGGQQDVAGGESRPRFANWARGAGLLGHSGAAQRCGPCRRKHHGQSEARANRAMRHCVRQPHNVARGGAKGRRWQRSSKDVGRRQTAGQRSVPGVESNVFANWACGAGMAGRRDAEQQSGPRRRRPQDRSETRAKRPMWHGARQIHNVAHGSAQRRRKRWGEQDVGRQRAAGQQAMLFGESHNALRIGHAPRASLDMAARRNCAGRIVASNTTGGETHCGMVRGEITALRAATTPRRRG